MGPEMDSMRERFSIDMRTEITNKARERVQDWQRNRLPSGPLQAGRSGNGVGEFFFISASFFFFFVKMSADGQASRVRLGT